MKLIHLSDLHIGKKVNEISMLDEQKYIFTKIINIIDDENPDGVLIAGDVFDKSTPSAEALMLFDDFLFSLKKRGVKAFIISGNHDSPERISFGGRIMEDSRIFLSPVFSGTVQPLTLSDEFGEANVYLLPFIKPAHVRSFFPEEEISSYNDAVRIVVESMKPDTSRRNILVTHQFVTGALRSDSEDISVGGSDNIDAAVFADFDYVALGHIHGPQNIGRETVRYCGTPLKYSFSEISHEKSVTVVELKEKGNITVRTVPLIPEHDMREIKGSYMQITAKEFYEEMITDDYLHIILTDEEDIPDAIGRLRAIYPNVMKLDYDNLRTRSNSVISGTDNAENKTPFELFSEFYEKQNNQAMSDEQAVFISELIEKVWAEQL